MTNRTTGWLLLLLLVVCFSLATFVQPRSLSWRGQRAQADTMLKVLLGDGRRMFANHFFTKADVYLHSGYYPSIFDQAKLQCEDALTGGADPHDHDPAHASETGEHAEHEHEAEHGFLGKPKDWLDEFSRRFRITEHAHLSGGGTERELLPWLKLSAELDPHQVEIYTVTAYWLRSKLGKVKEAEQFLRDGLRANPESEEILFELGRLLYESHHDTARARNVWELAIRKWQANQTGKPEPDKILLERILANLAHLEENDGRLAKALEYLRQLKVLSPHPEAIEKQIQDLQRQLN